MSTEAALSAPLPPVSHPRITCVAWAKQARSGRILHLSSAPRLPARRNVAMCRAATQHGAVANRRPPRPHSARVSVLETGLCQLTLQQPATQALGNTNCLRPLASSSRRAGCVLRPLTRRAVGVPQDHAIARLPAGRMVCARARQASSTCMTVATMTRGIRMNACRIDLITGRSRVRLGHAGHL